MTGAEFPQGGLATLQDKTQPPKLIGEWSGSVHTYKGEVPFTLWFKESGDVHAQLGEQLKTLLNDVSFTDGYLEGRMMGDIGTEDANRRPYHLHVTLNLREDVLNGAMIAKSLPGRKMGNALSHWVELTKQEVVKRAEGETL